MYHGSHQIWWLLFLLTCSSPVVSEKNTRLLITVYAKPISEPSVFQAQAVLRRVEVIVSLSDSWDTVLPRERLGLHREGELRVFQADDQCELRDTAALEQDLHLIVAPAQERPGSAQEALHDHPNKDFKWGEPSHGGRCIARWGTRLLEALMANCSGTVPFIRMGGTGQTIEEGKQLIKVRRARIGSRLAQLGQKQQRALNKLLCSGVVLDDVGLDLSALETAPLSMEETTQGECIPMLVHLVCTSHGWPCRVHLLCRCSRAIQWVC